MLASRRVASWISLSTLAIVLTCAPAAGAHGHALSARQACPTAVTVSSNARLLRGAILCLHNFERSRRGLSQLRLNADLSSVALKHARDMVKRRYFSHFSAGGKDQMDRIAASAYPPSAGCWTAGENLLAADGSATALQLFQAWMHSPEHRAVIRHRGWRDFGLGIVGKSPQGDPNGLTVVVLFGLRSRASCG
jgi:uncharacterized protein YkwD